MDTEKDFEEATGTGIDEADIATLDVVEDEEPIDLDEKIPDDIDPDADEDKDKEDEDDVEKDIADYIFEAKYDEY